MRYADIRSDVRSFSQRTSADDDLVNRAIAQAIDEIVNSYRWPFMLTEGTFFTVDPYSTGTVDVTNGSRTLTGNSTTFTRLMVGRKFRLSDTAPVYRITGFTSTTSLTLDRPYDGANGSAQTYSIFQDEYLLAPDMDTSKLIRRQTSPMALAEVDPSDFDIVLPYPIERANSRISLVGGRSVIPLTHQNGSITISSGARALTGTSTAWLTTPQGLGRGSKIRIGTAVYHVRSVDSDTAITLYETAASAVTSSTDWAFVLDNPIIQIWPIPDDNRQFLYRYYRTAQPLSADSDIADIPEQWHWLIIRRAVATMFLFTGESSRYQNILTDYANGLAQMRATIGRASQETRHRLKSIDERESIPSAVQLPAGYPRLPL